VRKPGAFARYLYREELFPRPVFRQAYDRLVAAAPALADRRYLELLALAARTDETRVAAVLGALLRDGKVPHAEAVEAHLPAGKTLASVDHARLPDKVRRQLPTLLTGEFIRRGDNLLCFGLPGRGKTLFLAALCRELVQQLQLPILYTTAHRLVTELLIAKRDLKLERLIAKLGRFAAIAIDDLGYTQQSREEMEVLFTLLAERYEKKSVLLTSNLIFSQWDQIFKDPMMTMAAVDRLVHHAVILEFNGRSYRADEADAAKTKPKG
jgi:DNA replication protein DnaC